MGNPRNIELGFFEREHTWELKRTFHRKGLSMMDSATSHGTLAKFLGKCLIKAFIIIIKIIILARPLDHRLLSHRSHDEMHNSARILQNRGRRVYLLSQGLLRYQITVPLDYFYAGHMLKCTTVQG